MFLSHKTLLNQKVTVRTGMRKRSLLALCLSEC
jgi:hypothetical protein